MFDYLFIYLIACLLLYVPTYLPIYLPLPISIHLYAILLGYLLGCSPTNQTYLPSNLSICYLLFFCLWFCSCLYLLGQVTSVTQCVRQWESRSNHRNDRQVTQQGSLTYDVFPCTKHQAPLQMVTRHLIKMHSEWWIRYLKQYFRRHVTVCVCVGVRGGGLACRFEGPQSCVILYQAGTVSKPEIVFAVPFLQSLNAPHLLVYGNICINHVIELLGRITKSLAGTNGGGWSIVNWTISVPGVCG